MDTTSLSHFSLKNLALTTASHVQSSNPKIPFHYFARMEKKNPSTAKFHGYSLLPVELQLLIIERCAPATLFRLMWACSSTRILAQKVYWSLPDVWYEFDSAFFMYTQFNLYKSSLLDKQFLSHVQQIEFVDFGVYQHWERVVLACPEPDDMNLEELIKSNITRIPDVDQPLKKASKILWTRICTTFPSLKRLVLRVYVPQIDLFAHEDEDVDEDDAYSALYEFSNSGPQHISVLMIKPIIRPYSSAFVPVYLCEWKNQSLIPSQNLWIRSTISMPIPKASGITRRYQAFYHNSWVLTYRREALWVLHIEAIEKLYFGQGRSISFTCPRCELLLSKPNDYSLDVSKHIALLEAYDLKEKGFPLLPPKIVTEITDLINDYSEEVTRYEKERVFLQQKYRDPMNKDKMQSMREDLESFSIFQYDLEVRLGRKAELDFSI